MDKDFEDMSWKEQYKLLWKEFLGDRNGADELLKWMEEKGFFESPASTKYHGSYPGGLCQHSINVTFNALDLCGLPAFAGVDRHAAAVAALLHDICKVGVYRRREDGRYEYFDDRGIGHGTGSVLLAKKYITLTLEEQAAIRWHMGMYSDMEMAAELAAKLSGVYSLCPLALLIHHADMMATYCGGEEKQEK